MDLDTKDDTNNDKMEVNKTEKELKTVVDQTGDRIYCLHFYELAAKPSFIISIWKNYNCFKIFLLLFRLILLLF
jgi:hypothetical protein